MTQDFKSNSAASPPSALSSDSLANLADRMKARTQTEAIAIQKQTALELTQHQQKLSELFSAALDITDSAISSHVRAVKTQLLNSEIEINTSLTKTVGQISNQGAKITKTLSATHETVKGALGQTTLPIKQQQKTLQAALKAQTNLLLWVMKVPLMVLLIACLFLCVGAWAWTRYQLSQLDRAAKTLNETTLMLAQESARLDRIKTWGIDLVSTSSGSFIVLPAGATADLRQWQFGQRNAVQLFKK